MDGRINDGGPAFPRVPTQWGDGIAVWGEPGMTLRDYFAAKAMQGDLSSWPGDAGSWVNGRDELARRYYLLADAMLIARSARPAGDDE